MRDSIDFGSMNISTLFRKLLIPTVLGMIFSAVFVITDGIFVGKGIGSDALAAVNITAPLFMITTGIGLMFGMGASVVASIHLSQGKVKVANINITQAIGFASLLILILSALCCLFLEPLAHLLGSSERLLPGVMEYMIWYIPFLVFYLILNAGMFFIRLDGSPNYAMMCNAIAAVTNILLDYIFIFRFGWGLMGAAFATSLGTTIGGLMTVGYLLRRSHTLHLQRIKLSRKSMQLTARNIGYMVKLGSSAFVTELSIAFMMFLGNYVFISHLGEDGVAAFSIACYFFPIIFMIYDAIVLSGQPILSYNFGLRDTNPPFDVQNSTPLRNKFFHPHRPFPPPDCRSVYRTGICSLSDCSERFALLCLRLYIFRRQYDWNRLLSKYRTGTSGYRHHPATRDTIYAGGLPGASYITRCKRNMAGRPSGRSTHPSPDRQPLSARKAETEVLNLPKSALLLWRTFGLVRRPYDYLNLKLSTIFAGQKEQINYGSLYREILPKV